MVLPVFNQVDFVLPSNKIKVRPSCEWNFFSPKQELCDSAASCCSSVPLPLLPKPANLSSEVAPLGWGLLSA